jgi:hypothetical protein
MDRLAWVSDEDALTAWGGEAWVTAGSLPLNPATGGLVCISANADATNRLSRDSPAGRHSAARRRQRGRVDPRWQPVRMDAADETAVLHGSGAPFAANADALCYVLNASGKPTLVCSGGTNWKVITPWARR